MNSINFSIDNGWYFFLLIPAIALALLPYFRLNKKYRMNRNRVASMVIHVLIVTLLTLPLAGFKVNRENVVIKNQVIIVADISASTKDLHEVMTNKVIEIIENADSDYEVGIVTFASDAMEVASLSKNHTQTLNKFLNNQNNLNLEASNIANALKFAKTKFTNGSEGRIVLITDGLETDGNVLAEARDLASSNIRIDVLYIPASQPHAEVQISDVKVPNHVNLNDHINIEVTVDSRTTTQATIEVYVNDILINVNDTNKFLNATTDRFNFDYKVVDASLNEIRVEISHANDMISENNTYYSFVYIDKTDRTILIVEGRIQEASILTSLIIDSYNIETVTPSDLSNIELNNYEQVILVNVANSDLPVGADLKLKNYVEVLGGGLLTIGGDKAYQEADMANSVYESLLPVFSSTQGKSMAVMLVIDSSGSMITHDSDKFDLAKLGAELSVLALGDSDYVGVITFDETPRLISEPVPVTRKDEVIDLIRDLFTRKGTKYTAGLQMAKEQLNAFPGNENFDKHVIFLTDGQPTDTGYMDVIDTYGDISLTTISLGRDHGIDPALLESMVRVVAGRGQYYDVYNESELPDIMEAETLSIASDYSNIGVFEPHIQTRIAAVAEFVSLPTLDGYYGTRLKFGATLVLSKESDPIFAKWQVGRGFVSSFMSDLNGRWSGDFLADFDGQKLVKNIVSDLMPEEIVRPSNIIVNFVEGNLTTEVRVNTLLQANENILLKVKKPDGSEKTLELASQTDFVHTQIIDTDLVGIYEIEITKDGGVSYKTYYAVSYSKEYNNFYDEPEVFAKIQEIANIGNGEIVYETSNIFSREIQTYTKTSDPTLAILVSVLVLFLLDIISRKFKFKLPSELLNKKNNS